MAKKKEVINQPLYDEYYKYNLENRDVARDYIQRAIPQELNQYVDYEQMELEQSEYIDEELKKLMTDVLWSLPIRGKKSYVYILCEHESNNRSIHKLMPFRLLRYMIRIMEKHLKKGHDKLPIIIPVVLYHGKGKYNHSTSLYDCFDNRELAEKYAFMDFKLIDLNTMSDEEIAEQGFRFFFELVLKYARDRYLAKKLVEYLENHPDSTLYFQDQGLKQAFVKLLMTMDIDSEAATSETFKKLDDLTGANIMTLREQWESKAKIQGIEQGIEQGALQGKQETAIKMLKDGLSIDVVKKYTGLDVDIVEKLKREADGKTKH